MMRTIITQEDRDKKSRRNKIVIGIILVGLMVLSTAGYAFYGNEKASGSTSKLKYNNFNFILEDDGFWHSTINGYEFLTINNPKETENVSGKVSLKLIDYQDKPLYFSYDSNRDVVSEIARNIEKFALRSQFVCLDNCSEDFPIKTCNDNVIIIKDNNQSRIMQENNCVYIFYNEQGLKEADSFIFNILGVK